MDETISLKRFAEIDLNDTFFDSLKEDYPGFETWFQKKSKDNSKAYVQYTNNNLQAFLYLKNESGEELSDVTPVRPACNRMKVGTFKIDAHNTKLGERFVKKIMDAALYMKADEIYVTIFPKHEGLIRILQRYGFNEEGKKGEELVLVKNMKALTGDIIKDYPLLTTTGKRKFLLSQTLYCKTRRVKSMNLSRTFHIQIASTKSISVSCLTLHNYNVETLSLFIAQRMTKGLLDTAV